jgi:lipopolysaccharide/colanic/teichoic acid biosynthesis glycosyltransferase
MGYLNTSLFIVALNMRARHQEHFYSQKIRIYPLVKRLAEFVFSIVLLMLLAPLFLLLTLAIRLESPGPALFRQIRIGKSGKSFTFYKFRSMYNDIDKSAHEAFMAAYVNGQVNESASEEAVFKPIQTNQVTRMGRLLRKTSLDELPQLINILKGEMSFIGPRPNVPAEVTAYKDWHNKRLEVLPGITGWAQINGRSSIAFDQIVRYDIEYVENTGLMMDLKVLWYTVPAVLLGRGAK